MANVPNDQIDPYEGRLSRRVGAYTDQAVQPIDAFAVASTAVAGARRRGGVTARLFGSGGAGAGTRLGLIGAGAVLVVAAGVVISGGANGLFAPAPTAPATAEAVPLRACTPNDVDAVITAWDGAAGHRIATVELHQIGSSECTVEPLPQPWLAGGQGDQLIVGHAGSGAPISFAPGEVLHTLVQVGNYCGPAPAAPVTVVFQQDSGIFVATALTKTDLSGLPPCMGVAGPTDDITMHPWQQ
jgi:hypothetical protein